MCLSSWKNSLEGSPFCFLFDLFSWVICCATEQAPESGREAYGCLGDAQPGGQEARRGVERGPGVSCYCTPCSSFYLDESNAFLRFMLFFCVHLILKLGWFLSGIIILYILFSVLIFVTYSNAYFLLQDICHRKKS